MNEQHSVACNILPVSCGLVSPLLECIDGVFL